MLTITVNGSRHTVTADPETPLLYFLRNDLELGGPKFGCGLAQCGACTVHLGGAAIRSCVTPLSAIGEESVTTIEGLGTPDRPHLLQLAFIEHQAAQCGYCVNGMIMSASAMLAANPSPDEQEIRERMAGNLCRCGTHIEILAAIRSAIRGKSKGMR